MVVILIFICAGIYLTVSIVNVEKSKSGNAVSEEKTRLDGLAEKINPITVKYNIKSINEMTLVSYLEQKDEMTYYSNIKDLEKDAGIHFLKPEISEYDANNKHVIVMQGSGNITINYYAARSRKGTDDTYQYFTYVDQFPTFKPIPEPQFPGRDDQQLLDSYYIAMRDYWNSLEYYQIEMNTYNDVSIYDETLLINNDDGKINCDENYTNANGIPMIIRGYDRAYDVSSNQYMEKMENPYVTEHYGFFKASFADEYVIYDVSGNTDLESFHTFLDMFGER